MEEQWIVDREHLCRVVEEHPDWGHRQLAEETGRSVAWVKKWRQRLSRCEAEQKGIVILGASRKHITPYPRWAAPVVDRIKDIRERPPENLGRTPGPVAILYYLQRDQDLQAKGLRIPRGATTIWKILHREGYYPSPPEKEHEPVDRPEPMQSWEMDFKDASSVPAEPEGKQAHIVEVLNFVDEGTSILVDARPHPEYNAETALGMVADVLRQHGCPKSLTFDRDPRFVGSSQGNDFPTALIRFLLCLGIKPIICPPHRPDKNPFVERYHRSYGQECLQRLLPKTLEEVEEVTGTFHRHYNFERPNQAITCGNRPPRVAYPDLPELPRLPVEVDPDSWLAHYHGRYFTRRITSNGTVQVDKQSYYIQDGLKGQFVLMVVDAQNREFIILLKQKPIKKLPIKGLYSEGVIAFEEYLKMSLTQARSEWQEYLWKKRQARNEAATM